MRRDGQIGEKIAAEIEETGEIAVCEEADEKVSVASLEIRADVTV